MIAKIRHGDYVWYGKLYEKSPAPKTIGTGLLQADNATAAQSNFAMGAKVSAFNDAPPTRAPSMSAIAMS